jgi:hypothetical protein
MAIDQERVWPPGSTPPKSAGRIRKTLKAIHVVNEQHPPGPYRKGLGWSDWIIVESLKCAGGYLRLLRRHRIEYRVSFQCKRIAISVRLVDLPVARRLLMCPQEQNHEHLLADYATPSEPNAVADCLAVFGFLVLGAVWGVVAVVAAAVLTGTPADFPNLLAAGMCMLGLFIGLLSGWTSRPCRRRH